MSKTPPTFRSKKGLETPKLKPAKRKVKHGVHSLEELLKGDLDGRFAIAKRRDQLEAEWVDHCGGPDRLTPAMISLIKRITHQELMLEYAEKTVLLGLYQPDKTMQARINSQRLNILALENLINANNQSKSRIPTIKEIVQAESTK